jgi:hypothetical protein
MDIDNLASCLKNSKNPEEKPYHQLALLIFMATYRFL